MCIPKGLSKKLFKLNGTFAKRGKRIPTVVPNI